VTLTRGGRRFNRLWVERDSWLPYVDILKMNLEEAGCSWFPERESPHPGERDMTRDQMPLFARHCLNNGVKAVCITLDEDGSVVYYFDSAGEFHEEFVPRIHVRDVVDTTGCGDSFAAGMAFGYLQHEDYVTACRFGNAMGAQRCSGSGLAVYRSLTDTESQIATTYGVHTSSV
jgi:adenosine kinase